MNLIAAADRNWAIGNKGRLLAKIPEDMQFFREKTVGGAVIMGRKTLESLPGERPLPDRTNIVLTRKKDYGREGILVVHSIEEAWELAEECSSQNVYVIGGGSIYQQLLPFCDTAYITRLSYAYEADTYFPPLGQMPEWHIIWESPKRIYQGLEYQFTTYERKKSPLTP